MKTLDLYQKLNLNGFIQVFIQSPIFIIFLFHLEDEYIF